MEVAVRLVTYNIASLDGRIAVSESTPSWLDPNWKPLERFAPVDVMALHKTRLWLEGSNSFTARSAGTADFGDYASREVPAGDFLPSSLRSHQGRWLVVVDSRARVRWTTSEIEGTKLAVLLAAATPGPYRAFLRDHDVPYFEAGRERVDLPTALARLATVFAADGIISDAGGVLNGALLRARLVDEVDVQFLPAIVGQADAPALFEGFGLGPSGVPALLELISAEARSDGSIFARYTINEQLRTAPDDQLREARDEQPRAGRDE
jgi:riboflavin biosynthesis pyrimidine reductase